MTTIGDRIATLRPVQLCRPQPIADETPPPRAPGLREVAALAGVSISTVSKVMNKNPSVTRATSARVQRAVERIGYRPNMAARALRGARTNTIAAVAPQSRQGFSDPYIGAILTGIRDRANALGYRILLEQAGPRAATGLASNPSIEFCDIDASLCIGCTSEDLPEPLRTRPAMLVDARLTNRHVDHVTCDYHAAISQAMLYLRQLGHRSIALVNPIPGGPRSRELIAAYHDNLGREVEPQVFEVAPTQQAGYEIARNLLEQLGGMTAIIATDDRASMGIMQSLRAPAPGRRLSLVAMGDLEPLNCESNVTVLRLPLREVGARACERLIARLAGDTEIVSEKLRGHLVLANPAVKIA